MNDRPDQPPDSDPTRPKSSSDPSPDGPEAAHLKRRFKRGGAETEDEETPDRTIQLLSTLLQDLIAKKEQPTGAEPEAKSSKIHRLSKKGAGTNAVPPETGSVTSNGPVSVAPSLSAGEAPGGSTPPQPLPAVSFRPAPLREPILAPGWLWLALFALLALGGLIFGTIGFFRPVRSASGAPAKTADVAAGAWSDAMLRQLDQALVADQAGDLKGAYRLASALKRADAPSPPGLDIYLASVVTRQDHTYDVEADLLRAVGSAPPEAAAAMNERLAFNFARARDFQKAADFFKVASGLDPFSAALFYHWGETLRHLGHFQEAAEVFRRALARVPAGQPEAGSLRECIELKQRLALVEQSREGDFQPEMQTQLQMPVPSGYWLLTAAAVALQHQNMPEAAGYLGRARDALGAVTFYELLNDYLFRAYADRKELADFFPPDRAARLQPTMTYTVEP